MAERAYAVVIADVKASRSRGDVRPRFDRRLPQLSRAKGASTGSR